MDDVRGFQHALAATVKTLRSTPEFKGVFGGPVHTVDQLLLASHREAFFLPVESAPRIAFFRRLNSDLLSHLGLSSDTIRQAFKLVLKGFNQKVGNQSSFA